MDLSFLEKIFVKYLEDHPEVVERLITDIVQKLLSKIETK